MLFISEEDVRKRIESFGRVVKKWKKPVNQQTVDNLLAKFQQKYTKAKTNQDRYLHRCELKGKQADIKLKFELELEYLELLYKTYYVAKQMFVELKVDEITPACYPYEYLDVEKYTQLVFTSCMAEEEKQK
ncbi:MAG: hypothetical protein E7378_02610 [Clostridiales bacterium]|nr:hypothetical protein [Clostridiales bacterium]